MNGLQQEAVQMVIEKPEFLKHIGGRQDGNLKLNICKIAETLKIISSTKCLIYDKQEFEREFYGLEKEGKKQVHRKAYFIKVCKTCGLNKVRIIEDNGKVYLFSNDK